MPFSQASKPGPLEIKRPVPVRVTRWLEASGFVGRDVTDMRDLVDTTQDGLVCGLTPLHVAATQPDKEMVKLILTCRPHQINRRERHGMTPLCLMSGKPRAGNEITNEMLEVAKLLLEYNADVHLKDKYGSTALHRAAAACGKGHSVLAKLLIDNGADLTTKDDSGKMPVQLCLRSSGSGSGLFSSLLQTARSSQYASRAAWDTSNKRSVEPPPDAGE